MKKLTKKIVISTAVSSTLLLGLTLTTHAATNIKPLTVSNQTILKKQHMKLQQIMKDAKLGKTTYNHTLDSIRLNTVKATLGKPAKEIEYKGSHIVTYNAGKYQLSFEFPSLYSTSDNQPMNPKVIDYSIYASEKTIQQTKLQQIMKNAKLGKTTTNHALDSIRLNTVKATLGKPAKEIEYKGSHIVTYNTGNYKLSFEFPSHYSTSDSQPKNPKVISYSIYK